MAPVGNWPADYELAEGSAVAAAVGQKHSSDCCREPSLWTWCDQVELKLATVKQHIQTSLRTELCLRIKQKQRVIANITSCRCPRAEGSSSPSCEVRQCQDASRQFPLKRDSHSVAKSLCATFQDSIQQRNL